MASGTPSTVSSPAFHADDPEQIADYRTLSVLAIVSLVFGIAAPLAMAGTLLVAIPLFGIAVSLLALRRIAVSGGVLAGRWAAMAGLFLCVASLVAPYSRQWVQRSIRAHQAKEFAQGWLAELTAGQTERAFRATVNGARRQPQAEPGAPAAKVSPYQAFLDDQVIKRLKAAGANADIRFAGTLNYTPNTYKNVFVRQQFAVSPAAPAGAESHPVEVVVTLQRAQLQGESMSRWLVSRYDDPNTAPAIEGVSK